MVRGIDARRAHGRQVNLWVCRHFDKRRNRNTTVKRNKFSRHEMAVNIAIEDTRPKEKRPGILKDVPTDGSGVFLIPCLRWAAVRTVVRAWFPINHLLTRLSLNGRQRDVVHG